MTKRIALYWHNGRGLGHTVRNATLGQALLDHMPDSAVIGITGASRGLDLFPPEMDFVKIPSYLAYDEQSGVRTTPILSITKSEFQRIRENLIATFVRDFCPEVLIVDYHPEGKKGELVPALLNSPATKKVLGWRGILKTATETNNEFFNPRMVAFIREHFSAIHVYIDPRVFRLEEYYQIPEPISKLLKYTGYIARPIVATKAQARALLNLDADARIIVVSFGGGQGTEMLWQSILEGLSNIRKHVDFAYLAAGPYLEADAYERLCVRITQHPNWKWTRLLDPLPLWIKASDLFIGSGGYNSLAEVIATGANTLIIPRHLSDREQELHSLRLARMGVLRIASLQTILSEDITKLLEVCLLEPYPEKREVQIVTHGAQENARLIQMLAR
jgi:predicted glycosyltransferase